VAGRRLGQERGASAVEFAMIVPLLVLLVVGIAEFGHAFSVQGTLSAAAREGARVMALQNDRASAEVAVRTAASTLDPAITDAQIDIDPPACPLTGGSAATTYVTVTISYPKPYLTGLFGSGVGLTAQGVMRCNG
jgi:Flp pilus assembly protein TadG